MSGVACLDSLRWSLEDLLIFCGVEKVIRRVRIVGRLLALSKPSENHLIFWDIALVIEVLPLGPDATVFLLFLVLC